MIRIDPNCRYIGLQRHFSRLNNPPPGKIWDWNCPLALNAAGQAERMRCHYFGETKPILALHSRIPRAKHTAGLMWPGVRLVEDVTLGPDNPDTADLIWAKSQNMPFTASGAELYAADPELVGDTSGIARQSVLGHAMDLKPGEFAWAASHCPYTDTILARLRQLILGLPENTGWLPGQFGSGAFAWITLDCANRLIGAEYYPAL